MTRAGLNAVLASLLAITALLTWMLRRDFTARNAEFAPGMLESVPYDAMAENPNFRDHATLRVPPQGTVARDFPHLPFAANAEDAARAGRELVNPAPDSAGAGLERGALVFAAYCSPCHGASGAGDGAVVQRGFPPPPSLMAEKARTLEDGTMFHIITFGRNNMPSLASQVVRADRWRAVSYIRSLQRAAAPAGAQQP